jgi:PAS domain S-box-containing protein
MPLKNVGRLLDTLAARATVGIFLTNAAGECLNVNPRLCEILGLQEAQLLGGGWERLIHPDDHDRVMRRWRAITLGEPVFSYEYRVITPAGALRWVLGIAEELRDADGTVSGYIGTLTDITDRKQAEMALLTASLGRDALTERGSLSPQERRILELVVAGKTNKEIGASLGLSAKTVKNYLSNAFQKLQVRRRSQAAAIFARQMPLRAG